MQRKRSKILILILILIIVITGCKKDEKNLDALKFKEEFESYNEEISVLDISENNPFVYTNDIYNLVENEKAFVLFYASPENEESRQMVKSIIDECNNIGLKKVYYIKTTENDNFEVGGKNIDKIPSLVAIIRKEVYSIINNKDDVSLIIDPVVKELNTCDIDVGC